MTTDAYFDMRNLASPKDELRGCPVASREEMHALRNWVRVRDKYRSKEKAQVLDEIEVAINATAKPS